MRNQSRNLDLFDAQGSRQADSQARDQLKLKGIELMQRAAHAALDVLLDRFPNLRSASIWCGKGDNAGDALLLAVALARLDIAPQVVVIEPLDKFTHTALAALKLAQQADIPLTPFAPELEIVGDVLVDGLLGTGVQGGPRPAFAAAIDRMNASQRPIFSLDIPSGVDASTGGVAGLAVKADLTVTFITHKIGLHTGAGQTHAGELTFADLGVLPASLPAAQAHRLYADVGQLPVVASQTYKHQQGHVLVVGGDTGMPGAVALASEAALRVGAGLVTVATRGDHVGVIVGRCPEVMVAAVEDVTWEDKLHAADVVVLGPGLGRSAWGQQLYQSVMHSNTPTVLDADGLFHLAQSTWQGGPLYITPHAGEAAHLLGSTNVAVEQDRPSSARALSSQYGAMVALKGPGTVVCEGDQIQICQHGNPGMATAGMGDVLAGMAGGLLAAASRQATTKEELGVLFGQAVALHSAAADLAVTQTGVRSLLARDVISALPDALRTDVRGGLLGHE